MPLVRVVIRGHLPVDNEPWEISHWVDSTSSHAVVHTAARDWLAALWLGDVGINGFGTLCITGLQTEQVETTVVDPATGRQTLQITSSLAFAGTQVGGACMPPFVAICVSLRTAIANRSGRGRFYLPAVHQSAVAGTGRLLPAKTTDLMNSLLLAYGEILAVGTPVLYRRTSRTVEPIVELVVENNFDTIRRRRPKGFGTKLIEPLV